MVEEEVKIGWEKDNQGNLVPEINFDDEQICLRCNKVPALKDGSDEGEYYCKKCIDTRKSFGEMIYKENKEKEKRHGKLPVYEDIIFQEKEDIDEEDSIKED